MHDYINRQAEERGRAWEEAKALLDPAAAEGRDLTGEETEKYDRLNKELDERAAGHRASEVRHGARAACRRVAPARAEGRGRAEPSPTRT